MQLASNFGPDFLYIGPDKSGSTWLYNVLSNHPQCFVPDAKDIYYFDKYYARGEDWYRGFFRAAPATASVKGEISHGYLFDEQAPIRIHQDFPEAKVMTTLRHPVERSISHYFYLRASGLINCPLQEAVQIRPGIIQSSLYYQPIKRFSEQIPSHLLHISFFEDLQQHPREHAYAVFEFLGLDALDCVDFGAKVREARQPKNVALAKMLKLAAIKARDLGFASMLGRIKNSQMINHLYRPLDKSAREVVTADDRAWLAAKLRDDTLRLEDFLSCDLQHWIEA